MSKRREIVDKNPLDSRMFWNDVKTWTLAEMTAAARLSLKSGNEIILREQLLQDSYGPWFEKQKERGLKDVALIADYIFPDNTEIFGKEAIIILCWYNDGSMSKMTVDYNSKEERLIVEETTLDDCQIEKPEFPDNGYEFHEALLDIAYVAPDTFWSNYFTHAAHIMESVDCKYEEQPDLFYLPKPYFKYLLAVMKSRIGGGMGSWNDTPIIGTDHFRIVTAELHYQRCRALLYAVNNCSPELPVNWWNDVWAMEKAFDWNAAERKALDSALEQCKKGPAFCDDLGPYVETLRTLVRNRLKALGIE